MKKQYDLDRLNVRIDERWSHPANVDSWNYCESDCKTYSTTYNPAIPEKRRYELCSEALSHFTIDEKESDPERQTTYDFDNYIHENSIGHITVTKPKELKKKKMPCLFVIPAGGLYLCLDHLVPNFKRAEQFGMVVVTTKWRCIFDEGGRYPGTIDDLENCYKYVIDHAEELGINPKRIVIWGESSGGHLSLALSHRLKKADYYGYMPRAVIAFEPIVDDRTTYLNSGRNNLGWSSNDIFSAGQYWLGYEHCNPAYVPAEAFANHATPEDCVGLPPTFIHTQEHEPSIDMVMEYYGKLVRAGVFSEVHFWGGADHSSMFYPSKFPGEFLKSPYFHRYWNIVVGNLKDCLKYDLTRPFVKEILEADEADLDKQIVKSMKYDVRGGLGPFLCED